MYDFNKKPSKKSKDISQEPIELQKIPTNENLTLRPSLEPELGTKIEISNHEYHTNISKQQEHDNQEELGQQKFPQTKATGLDTKSEDNSPFSVPFWKMPLKQTLSESQSFFQFGLNMVLSNASNHIIMFNCLYHIGQLNDAVLHASFGIGMSFFSCMFCAMSMACLDATAIQCAKWYGSKNFYMMSVSQGQGFVLSGLLTIFSFCTFFYAKDILIFVSIAEDNAILVQKMAIALIPGTILQTINLQFMGFITAQKIDKPFGISNFASAIICFCVTGYLVNDLKVGVYLFPICKLIMEITNSLAVLYSLIFKIEKGSLICIKMKDICDNHCKEFMIFGIKNILATYAEYMNIEFNILLVGITHDQNQISAFVSWCNFTDIIYRIGCGFGIVTRTRVSNYVGEKNPTKAKNSQLFYFFLVGIISLIIYVLIVVFKSSIADIYTGLPEVHEWLNRILAIYTIGAISEVITNTLNTTMRIANRTNQTIYVTFFCFVVQQPIQSYIFCFVLNMGAVGLVLSFVISTIGSNVIFVYIIYWKIDWTQVEIVSE